MDELRRLGFRHTEPPSDDDRPAPPPPPPGFMSLREFVDEGAHVCLDGDTRRGLNCEDCNRGEYLAKKVVSLELPAGAIQLLYDVLGHFPHAPGSWSADARARCSVALHDALDS